MTAEQMQRCLHTWRQRTAMPGSSWHRWRISLMTFVTRWMHYCRKSSGRHPGGWVSTMTTTAAGGLGTSTGTCTGAGRTQVGGLKVCNHSWISRHIVILHATRLHARRHAFACIGHIISGEAVYSFAGCTCLAHSVLADDSAQTPTVHDDCKPGWQCD